MATPNTPLWEVFIRSRNGLAHKHVGSLHATDATLALQAARSRPEELARQGFSRVMLDGRMTELAGELHDGNREQKAKELVQVSRRISRAGAEIDRLRRTLSQLRAHATAVRATA